MKKLSFVCLFAAMTLLLTNCRKNDNNTPPVDVKPVAVDFIIADSGVHVNANGFTPLSAQLNFNSIKGGRTFIKVHGRHGALSDVIHLFSDTGVSHSIPVIGMYADTTNTVDVRVIDANGDTLAQSTATIVTQALPSNMPVSITADKVDEAKTGTGMYLVSNFSTYGASGKPYIPYIVDVYGDIRWVLDYSGSTELSNMYYEDGIARLRNGNFYFGNSINHTIYEVDVLGNILNRWTMPGYLFHHEVHEEANGNFILTASKEGSTFTNGHSTVEDYVIEIDRNTKQISTVWDLKESLNEYRTVMGDGSASGDWFHGNAVTDDSTDNTIIVSGRSQCVVKLDKSNNVKWILAPHKDWGVNRRGDSLNKYLLTPLDGAGKAITDSDIVNGYTSGADFEWNYYQHSAIKIPNGDLLLFDNGTNRALDAADGNAVFNGAPGKYSRAVEFKINEANMTVQQVWQYGKERDVACYSSIVSSVQYLPGSNHVVFSPGAFVQNANGKGGKIVEIDYNTREVTNEISVTTTNMFGFHRAKKINVYPDNL